MPADTFLCDCCRTECDATQRALKYDTWCQPCWDAEQEEARNDPEGHDDWEDPIVTYERERGEAWQDRYDMWRREY